MTSFTDVYGARPYTVVGTNPAANVEFSQTVPAGKIWQLLAISVSLAQGATQTPQPVLVITDGTNTVYQAFGASSAQNSAVTTQYTWAPGLPLSAAGASTIATAPLPQGLVLTAGYVISSSTIGKGANTDYAAPVFFVNEFPA
jgi:multisubunit Na+/H+ antiporter MnhC subunit